MRQPAQILGRSLAAEHSRRPVLPLDPPRRPLRRHLLAWLPLVVLPGLVLLAVPPEWPRWGLMWAMAFAVFGGAKWFTWRRRPVVEVPIWRHAAFLLAWPGLDAAEFLCRAKPERPPAREWLTAVARLIAGVLLFYGIARLFRAEPYAAGWIGMIGLVLALHFGLFHLLSCAWRRAGIDARPLMQRPLRSTSLSDFWGRRWNRAFRDFAHDLLFRPLHHHVGRRAALFAGFGLSGLLHELVISVPASAGYGGPTLYFLLQALGMTIERSSLRRAMVLRHGWRGWLFTMVVVAGPIALLFHPPFVNRVIVPFMVAAGAI